MSDHLYSQKTETEAGEQVAPVRVDIATKTGTANTTARYRERAYFALVGAGV